MSKPTARKAEAGVRNALNNIMTLSANVAHLFMSQTPARLDDDAAWELGR
jgi:hypothetical protein